MSLQPDFEATKSFYEKAREIAKNSNVAIVTAKQLKPHPTSFQRPKPRRNCMADLPIERVIAIDYLAIIE